MRLVICAASTAAAGAGHLARCLAVAEEARSRGWAVSMPRDPTAPLWLASLMEASGAQLIAPGPPLESMVRGTGAVLLLDGYDFDSDLRARVHAVGGLLVNIEDGEYGRRPADLVLDPGICAESRDRPDDGSGTVLRGAGFALIRRAIREPVRAPAVMGSAVSRVLVVMGGTDAAMLTDLVIDIIEGLGPGMRPEMARGNELGQQLAHADLVVSAAGVTALEACVVGTPMALIQVADNQALNYVELIRSGNAFGLGDAERVRTHPTEVAVELRRFLDGDIHLDRKPLVDGKGASRLCDAISAMFQA